MRAARAGAAMRTSAARVSAPVARTAPRRTLGSPSGEPGTLFGESAGDAMQGWEPIVYSCYGACTVLLVVGLANKPTTSINSWAKEEAAVRLKLKEKNEDLVGRLQEHGVSAEPAAPPRAPDPRLLKRRASTNGKAAFGGGRASMTRRASADHMQAMLDAM